MQKNSCDRTVQNVQNKVFSLLKLLGYIKQILGWCRALSCTPYSKYWIWKEMNDLAETPTASANRLEIWQKKKERKKSNKRGTICMFWRWFEVVVFFYSVHWEGNRRVKHKINSDFPDSERIYNMIITVIGSFVDAWSELWLPSSCDPKILKE